MDVEILAIELYPNLLLSSLNTDNTVDIYKAVAAVKTLKIMLIMVAIGAPLVGNPENILNSPGSMVVSESFAKRVFGKQPHRTDIDLAKGAILW